MSGTNWSGLHWSQLVTNLVTGFVTLVLVTLITIVIILTKVINLVLPGTSFWVSIWSRVWYHWLPEWQNYNQSYQSGNTSDQFLSINLVTFDTTGYQSDQSITKVINLVLPVTSFWVSIWSSLVTLVTKVTISVTKCYQFGIFFIKMVTLVLPNSYQMYQSYPRIFGWDKKTIILIHKTQGLRSKLMLLLGR